MFSPKYVQLVDEDEDELRPETSADTVLNESDNNSVFSAWIPNDDQSNLLPKSDQTDNNQNDEKINQPTKSVRDMEVLANLIRKVKSRRLKPEEEIEMTTINSGEYTAIHLDSQIEEEDHSNRSFDGYSDVTTASVDSTNDDLSDQEISDEPFLPMEEDAPTPLASHHDKHVALSMIRDRQEEVLRGKSKVVYELKRKEREAMTATKEKTSEVIKTTHSAQGPTLEQKVANQKLFDEVKNLQHDGVLSSSLASARSNDRFKHNITVVTGKTEDTPDEVYSLISDLAMPRDKLRTANNRYPPTLYQGKYFDPNPIVKAEEEVVADHIRRHISGTAVMLGGRCIDPKWHWDLVDNENDNLYNYHVEAQNGNCCQCKYHECVCTVSPVAASLYGLESLTLPEIAVCANRYNDIIATFYDFHGSKGQACSSEISYSLVEHSSLPCHTYNINGYNMHNNYYLSWKETRSYPTKNFVLNWKVVAKFGDTVIVHFFKTFKHVKAPKYIPFDRAIGDQTAYGSVDLRGLSRDPTSFTPVVADTLQIDTAICLSCGPFLMYIRAGKENVMIPKSAVSSICSKFYEHSRDEDTWQLCIRKTRQILEQGSMTSEMMERAIPIVAALGYTRGIKPAVKTWTAIVAPMSRWFNVYNNSLKLKFPCHVSIKLIICLIVTIACITAIGLTAAGIEQYHEFCEQNPSACPKTSPGSANAPSLIILLLCLLFPMFNIKLSENINNNMKSSVKHYEDHCCQEEIYDHRLTYMPPYSVELPGRKGRMIRTILGKIKKTEHDVCSPSIGTSTRGPTLRHYRPVVARSCTHNAEIAIRNRAILQRQPDDEDYWMEINDLARRKWKFLFDDPYEIEPTPFNQWVDRFPVPRRKLLTQAYGKLKSGVAKPWDNIEWRNESFIKRECLNKIIDEYCEAFSPRLIQGRTPVYQVATGPWTHAFTSHLKHIWHANHIITYSAGMTANQIGFWLDNAVNQISEFGRPVAVEDDMGRFDGRFCESAISTELNIYDQYTTKSSVKKALSMQLYTKGSLRFKNQIMFYKVPGTRKSGDGNTSCGNTLINGLIHLDWISQVGVEIMNPMKTPFRMLVLGDDMLLITTSEIAQRLKLTVDRIRRSSMEPELIIHDNFEKSSYCSGYFYPSTNGRIWGPKIGRCITKLFHCRHKLDDLEGKKWARGVALGMLRDTKHIPVLRTLIDVVLTETNDLGSVPIIHGDKHRPHVTPEGAGEANLDTMSTLFDIYGLTPEHINKIEDEIKEETKKHGLGALLQHPALEIIVEHDTELRGRWNC